MTRIGKGFPDKVQGRLTNSNDLFGKNLARIVRVGELKMSYIQNFLVAIPASNIEVMKDPITVDDFLYLMQKTDYSPSGRSRLRLLSFLRDEKGSSVAGYFDQDDAEKYASFFKNESGLNFRLPSYDEIHAAWELGCLTGMPQTMTKDRTSTYHMFGCGAQEFLLQGQRDSLYVFPDSRRKGFTIRLVLETPKVESWRGDKNPPFQSNRFHEK